jgi:hypothetical protein
MPQTFVLPVPLAQMHAQAWPQLAAFDQLIFIDGSVARRLNGRWGIYLQACGCDGQAGEFMRALARGYD